MRLLGVVLVLAVALAFGALEKTTSTPTTKEKEHSDRPDEYVQLGSCDALHPLLMRCDEPDLDDFSHQPRNCQTDNSFNVTCHTLNENTCGKNQSSFERVIRDGCSYGAYAHHSTAMLLSVFTGILGLDRIYLGYWTMGFIKMFTLGGLFILWFADMFMIALQALEPADGTGYIMPIFGPRAIPIRINDDTFVPRYFPQVLAH